jgi:heptosyltransferase-1
MVMRILIVKTSSMGDIVHAQPMVSDLREVHPNARIDWVCEAPFSAIPAMNSGISEVIPMAWRRWRKNLRTADTRAALQAFVARLRRHQYDLVIDCQGLLKSAAVARLARARERVGLSWRSAREPLSSLVFDRRAPVSWNVHVVARNRAVAAFAVGRPVTGPAQFGLTALPIAAPWLVASTPYVVCIPGASRPAKLWNPEYWVALARALGQQGFQVVWFWGSPDEQQRVAFLAAQCAPAVQSVIPPFLSVAEAAGVMQSAQLVVGLDTGLTHLAGALGRPTVGIFCDFDARQCAVSGTAPCASLGGRKQSPPLQEVRDAALSMLAQARLSKMAHS